MTNKRPFKLERGCHTQATCLATLRKVEGRSTFLATRNATIAVVKWGVTREFFLATCNATNVALQVARKIASCNIALSRLLHSVIKHDGHLRTQGKCRKHEPQVRVFYISRVFSNVRSVLSQCNTRLRLLRLLYDIDFTRRE